MATPPTERDPKQREQPSVEQPTKEPTGRFEPTGGRTAVETAIAADGSTFLRRPQLRGGKLPDRAAWLILGGVAALVLVVLLAVGFNPALFVVATGVLTAVVTYTWSRRVEGPRKATDRLMTVLVTSAFVLACLPLISLIYTVVSRGAARFDSAFFTETARGAIGGGGGAQHAIVGTLVITGVTTIISVPIGIMAAVYLQEYGTGRLRRALTFFVDVMTGIPSIVAGLFAYALFALFLGPGIRLGIMGSIALSVLMIPIVVRSTEEMLRIVPNHLREASYALGVPKWRTITKVVLPTALAGIVTGVMLSVARIVGETAPLLITTGVVSSMNTNPFDGRMQNLAVYAFNSYKTPGVPAQNGYDRAWAAALTLILIVMLLNLAARLVYRRFGTEIR
jgi:phosphate transport system permease protein